MTKKYSGAARRATASAATSRASIRAARASGHVATRQRAVLDALRGAPFPATAREVCGMTGNQDDDKRFIELERADLVRRCGIVTCSETGRSAQAWERKP